MNNKNNNYKNIPTMSPNKAAILGLIAVFFIFQFGGGLLALSVFGFDLNNADMNLMRLLTIGSQILFILFPAILFSKLVFEDVTSIIRFRMPHPKEVGLFSFGLFTRFKLHDKWVPIVAILAPSLSYILNIVSIKLLWGYQFGFEILIINGLFTFIGLLIISNKDKKKKNNYYQRA